MKQDFKKALEDAYGFKKPMQKEKFFQSLHNETQKQKKPVPFYIKALRYSAVPVTAAIAAIIFTGFINNSNVKNEFVSKDVSTDYSDNCDSENNCEETLYDTNYDRNYDINTEFTSIATSVSLAEANENISSLSAASSTAIYNNNDGSPIIYDDADTDTENSDLQNNITTTINTTASSAFTTATTKKTAVTTTTQTAPSHEETKPTTHPTSNVPVQTTTTHGGYEPDVTTTTHSDSNSSDTSPERDFRVVPSVTYNKTDNIIDITDVLSQDDFLNHTYDWKNSAKSSVYAVFGTVENVYYTSSLGVPYIQADISVDYSMKNDDLQYGDKISVYIPGGYMSLNNFLDSHKWFETELGTMTDEEINNSTVFNDNGNAGIISKGRKFLFFLNDGFKDMPDGAFTLCHEMDIFIKKTSLNSITYINAKNRNIRFTDDEYKNLKG